MDGCSLKDIAVAVGFKTPSAVSKHIEKLAGAYEDYVSGEYGSFFVNTQSNNLLIQAVTITVAAFFDARKEAFTSREPFETMLDVKDAKQLAKAGVYKLLNAPDFPTLRIGGRKLVMKNEKAD